MMLAAIVLLVKQTNAGAGLVVTGISLVAGLYFPVSLLPDWIQWASNVQPFTPAVDLLRYLLIGTPLEGSAMADLLKTHRLHHCHPAAFGAGAARRRQTQPPHRNDHRVLMATSRTNPFSTIGSLSLSMWSRVPFAEQTVLLNLKSGSYHGLNPIAVRMLEVSTATTTPRDAIESLASEYEQPEDVIERDLADLL